MAKTYRVTAARRLANAMMATLVRLGLGPKRNHLLTTHGRRSGHLRTTPVSLLEDEGHRWLVAPYGAVGWVHNVRASGEATLRRGRRNERVRVDEVDDAATAASVLKRYLKQERIVRDYFDVEADAPVAAFEGEARRHPVFSVTGSA